MTRSAAKPFFLYLCHYAVHNPQQAKPEVVAKYKAKAAALPPAAGPEFKPEGASRDRQVQDQPVYAAMVQSLDESVGRVMKELADRGLEKDTVVIFMSDNGGLSTAEGSPTSNLPLRAGKGWPYEGGVREPLIVKWPAAAKAGGVCRQPVVSTDFYPTILEMAGLPPRPTQHVDGVSFAPFLAAAGEGATSPPALPALGAPVRPLFWHYPHYSNQGGGPCGAVRAGDFKLVEWYEDGSAELYNLRDDLGEMHDLAARSPEKAAELKKQLQAWRELVKADMPTPNPDYDPKPAGGGKGKREAGAGRQERSTRRHGHSRSMRRLSMMIRAVCLASVVRCRGGRVGLHDAARRMRASLVTSAPDQDYG